MARPITAAQLQVAMKKWKVPVRYYSGWSTRGRPGAFTDLNGIVIHHTGSDAGQSDDYLAFLFKTGRPAEGIPGPLCQAAADMDGDLWIGASGRANHAGKGSSAVLAAVKGQSYKGLSVELKPGADNTDGNAHFYGCEVRYDGGQPMTPKQYDATVRWAAALCDFHKWSPLSIIGHREWTRRKSDPGHCPMNKFRSDVAARLKAGPGGATTTPTKPPEVPDVTPAQMTELKNHVTAEVNALETTMKLQFIWVLRYGLQIVDELKRYNLKFDEVKAGGGTDAQAHALAWPILAPLMDALTASAAELS